MKWLKKLWEIRGVFIFILVMGAAVGLIYLASDKTPVKEAPPPKTWRTIDIYRYYVSIYDQIRRLNPAINDSLTTVVTDTIFSITTSKYDAAQLAITSNTEILKAVKPVIENDKDFTADNNKIVVPIPLDSLVLNKFSR